MSLYPSFTYGALDLTSAPYAVAFGSDFGAPDTPTEALAMLLQDGEIEVSSRASNRTMTLTVLMEAAHLGALAEAEAALVAEAEKPQNVFTFDPGDGWGPATVYSTFRAQVTLLRDDNDEQQNRRAYQVTFKASPWGKSATQVVSAAVASSPVTPVTITIDAASSTTGWAATTGTLADAGAYLSVFGSAAPVFSFTGLTDLSATQYVSLLAWGNIAGPPSLKIDNAVASLVSQSYDVATGHTRYYFLAPAASGTVFQFTGALAFIGPPTRINFQSLQRTNVLPGAGTARESSRSLDVLGSTRTQGSFEVYHASSGLGTMLLYTVNSGNVAYSPALRQYRSGGGSVSTDASTVSGAFETLATPPTFDVPVSQLLSGKHQIVAFLKRSSAGTQAVSWTAQARSAAGANIGAAWSGSMSLALTTTYAAYVLGNVPLPPIDLPDNSTAIVRITLTATSAVTLDEGYLFNLDEGALTWVEAGANKRVWVDTATVDRPRPAIFVGTAADRSDAYNAAGLVQAWGLHEFAPPLVSAYIVTTGALSASADLAYFPAWHTYAAS